MPQHDCVGGAPQRRRRFTLDASSSPTTRRVPAPATGEVEDVASGIADARARRNRRHDVSVS